MERQFDVITFDCYGTLIDWESGIAGAFLRAAREDDIELRRDEVLRAYEQIEPVVEHEQFRLYRDVLTETAFRVARSREWTVAFRNGRTSCTKPRSVTRLPASASPFEPLRMTGWCGL